MIDSGSSRKVHHEAGVMWVLGSFKYWGRPHWAYDAAVYATVCGVYACTPNKLSQAYWDWHKVPKDQKNAVWQDIMASNIVWWVIPIFH